MRLSLSEIGIIYICLWVISPPLQFGIQYRLLVALFLVILLLDVLVKSNRNISFTKYGLGIILYFISVSVFGEFLFPDLTPFIWWIQNYIFFAFYFIMLKIKSSSSLFTQQYMLKLILLAQLIWATRSLQGLSADATIARVLTRSNDQAVELASSGYGGFGLVYSSLLCVPLFMGYIRKNYKGAFNAIIRLKLFNLDLLVLLNLLVTILVIMKAGYMLAICAVLLYLILGLVFSGGIVSRIVKSGLTLAIFFTLFSRKTLILVQDVAMTVNPNYGRKLNDILAYSSSTNLYDNTLYHRIERYTRSIKTFLDNPIFGALSRDNIGKHSATLDAFAHYGLLLGLLYFLCITVFLVREILQKNQYLNRSNFLLFLIFVFSTNNIVGSQGLVLFIVYPLLLNYAEYAKN